MDGRDRQFERVGEWRACSVQLECMLEAESEGWASDMSDSASDRSAAAVATVADGGACVEGPIGLCCCWKQSKGRSYLLDISMKL